MRRRGLEPPPGYPGPGPQPGAASVLCVHSAPDRPFRRGDDERIVVAQAAVGAILTVTIGEAGPDATAGRCADGRGVALVFSQVFFSREPVALVRRAEAAALADLAEGLETTA